QRRAAIAGIGAEEQDHPRGTLATDGAERVAKPERRVQSTQWLEQRLGWRALTVLAHHRRFDRRKRSEDLGVKERLDVIQTANATIEATQDVSGDRPEA